jgi:hypothetical protein
MFENGTVLHFQDIFTQGGSDVKFFRPQGSGDSYLIFANMKDNSGNTAVLSKVGVFYRCVVLRCVALRRIVLCCVVLCCVVLCCVAFDCLALIGLDCIVLCHIVFYCIHFYGIYCIF